MLKAFSAIGMNCTNLATTLKYCLNQCFIGDYFVNIIIKSQENSPHPKIFHRTGAYIYPETYIFTHARTHRNTHKLRTKDLEMKECDKSNLYRK